MSSNHFESIVGRLTGLPAPAAGRPPVQRQARHAAPVRWTLPGLCEGVRVTTSFGDLPIQALRLRDPLRTPAGVFARVEWQDVVRLDEDFLAANPDALPIRIPPGAFGNGRPERALVLSPEQSVNVSTSPYVQDFRPARDLLDRPGVLRQPALMVNYHLFHCGAPATVLAEGVAVRVSG